MHKKYIHESHSLRLARYKTEIVDKPRLAQTTPSRTLFLNDKVNRWNCQEPLKMTHRGRSPMGHLIFRLSKLEFVYQLFKRLSVVAHFIAQCQ